MWLLILIGAVIFLPLIFELVQISLSIIIILAFAIGALLFTYLFFTNYDVFIGTLKVIGALLLLITLTSIGQAIKKRVLRMIKHD